MAKRLRVAVNGFGVIGKRVAEAVRRQDDMQLVGVCDVTTDWRVRIVEAQDTALFGSTSETAAAMRQAGLQVAGTLQELLTQTDIVVDCTPKRIAAQNVETYRSAGLKFIVHGGEKHTVTGHSFVAEVSFASAIGREATGSFPATPPPSSAPLRRSSGPVFCSAPGGPCSAAPRIPGRATPAAS